MLTDPRIFAPLLTLPLVATALPSVASATFFGSDGVSCAHTNLQDAVDAAGAGGTVYVSTIGTIVGPGAVVDADLTIQGSDLNCTAAGTGDGTVYGDGGRLLDIGNGATVIINRTTFGFGDSTGNGGIIFLDGGASLAMFNSMLYAGSADGDGGCLFAAGDVSLWDTVIEGCEAGGNGGGIAMLLGDLFLDWESEATFGTATNGGMISAQASTVVVHGTVSEGTATNRGGGIWAEVYGTIESQVNLTGEITNNSADAEGGGVWVSGGDSGLRMSSDAVISYNDAADGGGVYATFWADVEMMDTATIAHNTALGYAGGLFGSGSDIDLQDSATIVHNEAGTYGGGVAASGATITVAGDSRGALRIANNTAGTNGGGVQLLLSTLEGDQLELSDNQADYRGGGLFAELASDVLLDNALFLDNQAGTAGAIAVVDSTVILESDFSTCTPSSLAFGEVCSEVRGNTSDGLNGATGRAGGVAVFAGGSFTGTEILFTGNDAATNGNDLMLQGADPEAALRNALVADPNASGLAIDVRSGTFDMRSSTIADQVTGVRVRNSATAVMHRNIFAGNTTGAVLNGTTTGNCNLAQTAAESPTGSSNDVGVPAFVTGTRSDYQNGVGDPLVVDVCGAGPSIDIDGKTRALGASYDRGVYERFPVIFP